MISKFQNAVVEDIIYPIKKEVCVVFIERQVLACAIPAMAIKVYYLDTMFNTFKLLAITALPAAQLQCAVMCFVSWLYVCSQSEIICTTLSFGEGKSRHNPPQLFLVLLSLFALFNLFT